jgi:hypothetical protein
VKHACGTVSAQKKNGNGIAEEVGESGENLGHLPYDGQEGGLGKAQPRGRTASEGRMGRKNPGRENLIKEGGRMKIRLPISWKDGT